MNIKPRIVRTWDDLPPIVCAEGEVFSTRVLEKKYHDMEEALRGFIEFKTGLIGYERLKNLRKRAENAEVLLNRNNQPKRNHT